MTNRAVGGGKKHYRITCSKEIALEKIVISMSINV